MSTPIQEFLSNPFFYWAILLGLVMATAIVVSSAFFMTAVALKFAATLRLRRTYRKIANLMYEVAIRNEQVNPDLSNLAKTLLVQLDPASTLFQDDMAEVRRKLGLPTLDELAASTESAELSNSSVPPPTPPPTP